MYNPRRLRRRNAGCGARLSETGIICLWMANEILGVVAVKPGRGTIVMSRPRSPPSANAHRRRSSSGPAGSPVRQMARNDRSNFASLAPTVAASDKVSRFIIPPIRHQNSVPGSKCVSPMLAGCRRSVDAVQAASNMFCCPAPE